MGWDALNDGQLGQNGGRFFRWPEKEGQVTTVRFLDEEPFSNWVHKVSQTVEIDGKERDVFRTIPATADLDDNYVQHLCNGRWAGQRQHHLRCIQIVDGEPIGDVMVLSGGKQIMEPIFMVCLRYGSITGYDFDISREGKGKATKYTVALAPEHAQIDDDLWNDLIAERDEKELAWENLFEVPTGEQQEQMFLGAGFDPDYDPAAIIAESMEIDEALALRMPGGKYKDKSLRDLVVIDLGYLQWVSDKYTSNDSIQAGARVILDNMDEVKAALGNRQAAPSSRQVAAPPRGRGTTGRSTGTTSETETDEDGAEPDPTSAPSAASRAASSRPARSAASPTPAASADAASLRKEVDALLSDNPQYEDAASVAALVKKFSGGKPRLRDMTAEQLTSLRDHLAGGEPAPRARARR